MKLQKIFIQVIALFMISIIICADPPLESNMIKSSTHDVFGKYITDGNGITLYMFELDYQNGGSNCYDNCAVVWPPFYLPDGQEALVDIDGTLVQSKLTTHTRTDGKVQLVYNGWALYYYKGETRDAGTIKCQAIKESGGLWFIINPNGNVNFSTSQKTSLETGKNTLERSLEPLYGAYFITTSERKALYMFEADSFLKVNCVSTECLAKWPPYYVNDPNSMGDMLGGEGVDTSLIYKASSAGGDILTYNGYPLYYYSGEKDAEAGTAKCQNVNDNGGYWWIMNLIGTINKSSENNEAANLIAKNDLASFLKNFFSGSGEKLKIITALVSFFIFLL